MRKIAMKTLSFLLMLFGMFYLTLWMFRTDWPILGWIVGIFFLFTMLVFPYKKYFSNK